MNKLLKLSPDQFKSLGKKLERKGVRRNCANKLDLAQEYRALYDTLSDMGIGDVRSAGYRARKPDYTELGMTRVAGEPSAEDIEKYARVTNGGMLDSSGYVCQILLFDNDLLIDRFAAGTFSLVTDLYDKYLGRANDYNHSFNAREAYCRIIDIGVGTDPGTALHPDYPAEAIRSLSPMNPFTSTYTGLYVTVAFPNANDECQAEINRVKSGLTKDVSLATRVSEDLCSVCLKQMDSFWWFSYCEEHGFPGGRTEDGQMVVDIWNHAEDAFVFGFVSDGAVLRAGTVLDPTIKEKR